ncbi:MAG: metal-dependent phosphohydrolase [Cyclobacteriaceae bacterium]|nr:metal-dependent phosphohydrolase [Cyclobacteriaceae bacterium]
MEKIKTETQKPGGGRGKETLFRVTFRNQINHIQIADNKANMIITINSLIITVLIGLSGYSTISTGNLFNQINIIIPVTLIILTCLLSVVFAIQAARPKIIRNKKTNPLDLKSKTSLLFFGTISNKSLDDYMNEMDNLINSKSSIYHTMVIDIYNQGKVLNRKYTLLSIAYQIFMYGFVFSVLTFLVIFLFSSPTI